MIPLRRAKFPDGQQWTADDRDALLYSVILVECAGNRPVIALAGQIVGVTKPDVPAARALLDGPLRDVKTRMFSNGHRLSTLEGPDGAPWPDGFTGDAIEFITRVSPVYKKPAMYVSVTVWRRACA